MIYLFRCDEHGVFEVDAPIQTGPGKMRSCPRCSQDAVRVYYAPPVHYHAQGFHTTDYDKTGDRLEKMNKTWSKQFGEAPPPPAKDIPKNSGEPV